MRLSVIPYVRAATLAPLSRACSAASLVGKGTKATTIRKMMLIMRNARSTRSTWVNMVCWFAQMIPMVRKLTA